VVSDSKFERMRGIGGRLILVFVLVLVTLVGETSSDLQAADRSQGQSRLLRSQKARGDRQIDPTKGGKRRTGVGGDDVANPPVEPSAERGQRTSPFDGTNPPQLPRPEGPTGGAQKARAGREIPAPPGADGAIGFAAGGLGGVPRTNRTAETNSFAKRGEMVRPGCVVTVPCEPCSEAAMRDQADYCLATRWRQGLECKKEGGVEEAVFEACTARADYVSDFDRVLRFEGLMVVVLVLALVWLQHRRVLASGGGSSLASGDKSMMSIPMRGLG